MIYLALFLAILVGLWVLAVGGWADTGDLATMATAFGLGFFLFKAGRRLP